MPNTLAHIGIQGPANRLFFSGALPQWMTLGCVLPDIPWISQRVLKLLAPGIDLYSLRLYSINQSSLFFCLILSAALALATRRFLPVFGILAINSFLHLVIDATQIKWANGVHLLTPFSWELLRFDWFWPEHISCYATTLAGLLFLLFTWKKTAAVDLQLALPSAWKGGVLLGLLLFYLLGPQLFYQQTLAANNHFLHTLINKTVRPGKAIEFDRGRFSADDNTFRPFNGETFKLQGQLPQASGRISLQGRFLTPETIEVAAFHQHSRFRDNAATLGILLVAVLWLHSLINTFQRLPHFNQGDHT